MEGLMKMFTILLIISITLFIDFEVGEAILINTNSTLLHWHPQPEVVVHEVQRRINKSARRSLITGGQCQTGNPIDDCWMCDPDWATTNRHGLADCAIGFGIAAKGGKGGRVYVVTDSSDNATNPKPGTLRYGVIQQDPLWIVFSTSMTIVLKHELIISSYKTLDGRGANVSITGHGCLTLQYVSHVIIHGIHVYGCTPSGNSRVASSPTRVRWRGVSDGDGISIYGSQQLWIDHCTLSSCTDGLIDIIMGSTAITISNNHFSDHDQVMLLGHDDGYVADKYMQVTIAFNYFGRSLVQRMPRCRHGYFHVVNNDYTAWKMYAVGGSANPTINSQGNRYIAPSDSNSKEVTKRVDTDKSQWSEWNWKSEGDVMVNGAFFVPSGDGRSKTNSDDNSLLPLSAKFIVQLTSNAGVFGSSRTGDGGDGNQNDNGNSFGMMHEGKASTLFSYGYLWDNATWYFLQPLDSELLEVITLQMYPPTLIGANQWLCLIKTYSLVLTVAVMVPYARSKDEEKFAAVLKVGALHSSKKLQSSGVL